MLGVFAVGNDKIIKLFCNDAAGKHTITRTQEAA